MKNSKRFRTLKDTQKHYPKVSKYAAKQAAKYDRDEDSDNLYAWSDDPSVENNPQPYDR